MKKTKVSHEVNTSTKGSSINKSPTTGVSVPTKKSKNNFVVPEKKFLQPFDDFEGEDNWVPKDSDLTKLGTTHGRDYQWCDFEEMEETLEKYFTECKETGKPPTISGLCVALGCHRGVLWDWEKNVNYRYPPRGVHLVRQAKALCHNWIEENALQGKANAAFSIFILKNSYGYVDKVETDITSNGDSVTTQPITINMPNTKIMSSNEKAIRTIKDKNDVDVDNNN